MQSTLFFMQSTLTTNHTSVFDILPVDTALR
jgi:hypothetical protein